MLILAGLGHKIEDIPLGVLEHLKTADYVLIEGYTNILDKEIIEFIRSIREDAKIVDREFIELQLERFIEDNKEKVILLLVSGSPLFATTHISIIEYCKNKNTPYNIIGAASVYDYIPITGLFIYKFGKTVSIPFHYTETPYGIIEENKKIGAHTLILLDIDPKNSKYLTVKEALNRLLELENKFKKGVINQNDYIIVCSNLGKSNQKIYYKKISEIIGLDFDYPACIIVPGNMNRIEEDILKTIATQ